MEKKILPTSRQNFSDLRKDNCIYVDKTQHIYNFCMEGKMYFLSRPRRFGKSLLLSTLDALHTPRVVRDCVKNNLPAKLLESWVCYFLHSPLN